MKDGALAVAVRKEGSRERVRGMLAELDLATILPGVRRLDISVGGGGRTGRERISEEDAAARAAARAAAEASPVVLRVLRKFGASLDSVEPLAEAPPAIPAEEPE